MWYSNFELNKVPLVWMDLFSRENCSSLMKMQTNGTMGQSCHGDRWIDMSVRPFVTSDKALIRLLRNI